MSSTDGQSQAAPQSLAASDQRTAQEAASGVQTLIDRLRQDGVVKGRSEGEALIAAARQEAAKILLQSQEEAEKIRATARTDAERLHRDAEQALRLAARDAVLELNEALRSDFVAKVKRMVSHTMQDRTFLERLILEVARRAMPEEAGGSVEVLLPRDVITSEELGKNPQDLKEDSLSRFVLQLSNEVLRDGLTFAPADDDRPGMRLQLRDQDVEIDLTDEAVTSLLIAHLSPRFRALMEQPRREPQTQREMTYAH